MLQQLLLRNVKHPNGKQLKQKENQLMSKTMLLNLYDENLYKEIQLVLIEEVNKHK